MKGKAIVLTLVILYIMAFCVTELAYCRSASLTTTIIITVKKPPTGNLAPNDRNAKIVEKLAKEQSMIEPYLKDVTPDVKFSGGKIYTITDRL